MADAEIEKILEPYRLAVKVSFKGSLPKKTAYQNHKLLWKQMNILNLIYLEIGTKKLQNA